MLQKHLQQLECLWRDPELATVGADLSGGGVERKSAKPVSHNA
jgi:hypothetical protein